MKCNAILAGLSGQGISTFLRIVATSAISEGFEAQCLEFKDLSRRLGKVRGHLRLGQSISAYISPGSADVLIALEMSESLGLLSYLRQGGVAIVSTTRIPLAPGAGSYPDEQQVWRLLQEAGAGVVKVPSRKLAHEAKEPRGENMVMLGVFSALNDLLDRPHLVKTIEEHFKDDSRRNVEAFWKGFDYVHEGGTL
jgi:indolepyruvate ferredoxin oxidoreductase beta subunit